MTPFQLYEHEPESLLPLLQSHLPYSLPVYGSIVSNPSSSLASGHQREIASDEGNNQVHYAITTFPSSALPYPPDPYVILNHLPSPMPWQVRLFCSAESDPNLTGTAKLEATNLVIETVKEHLKSPQETRMIGALSTVWSDQLRKMLGTRNNEICDVWLASEDNEMTVDGAREGLIVDIGRLQDCELVRWDFYVVSGASGVEREYRSRRQEIYKLLWNTTSHGCLILRSSALYLPRNTPSRRL